jgi:hypothetical protein
MGRSDKVISDAKHVESELKSIGEHSHAQRIARLRKGYSTALSTLRTIHRDNMKLRQKLGMPSFLDDQEKHEGRNEDGSI